METQSFANHVRVHPLYHYFAVPVSLALVLAAVVNLVLDFGLVAIIIAIATVLLHLAIFLSRHYAKKNQDRIIRAELRLRYYLLTQKRLEEIENIFTPGQLFALRFASDDELVELVKNPETPKKTPAQIKHSIIEWNADVLRV